MEEVEAAATEWQKELEEAIQLELIPWDTKSNNLKISVPEMETYSLSSHRSLVLLTAELGTHGD